MSFHIAPLSAEPLMSLRPEERTRGLSEALGGSRWLTVALGRSRSHSERREPELELQSDRFEAD